MKNIHVLPTDKPSRLYEGVNKELKFTDHLITNKRIFCQNIYITSDEEINQQTKPCWCLNTIKKTWDSDLIYYQGSMPQYHYVGLKKIILTTDQDLIKDGVQAIDDDFLEWFVKNPSCEEVEVENSGPWFPAGIYFINYLPEHFKQETTIPKEEPKQDLEKEMFDLEQELDIPSNLRFHNSKPKQETLEEAVSTYRIDSGYRNLSEEKRCKDSFIAGAKWQQERSYSKEEVYNIIQQLRLQLKTGVLKWQDDFEFDLDKWFEQFKRK